MYKLIYSTNAQRNAKKILESNLKEKCQKLLDTITKNPYQNPPPFEKLVGDLRGCLSRRINIQHRLVYEVFEKEKIIIILSMWSHYE
jgi:toxin YoeB